MNKWIENHVWTAALILTVVFSPVIIWGAWDSIGNVQPAVLRVVLCMGAVAVTYVGAGLLLMWNRWTQAKYRGKNN